MVQLTSSNNQQSLFTGTWNDASTVFTAWKLNVTDTASNASSLLMDLQVGGSSKFKVDKNGNINILDGRISDPGSGQLRIGTASTAYMQVGISEIRIQLPIGFTTSVQSIAADAYLHRDAAATLAQRNGNNAQTFRVYNTFTDASNYERGKIEWASNVLRIGTEKGGTGTARALEFQTDGTTRLTIGTTGNAEFRNQVNVTQPNQWVSAPSLYVRRNVDTGPLTAGWQANGFADGDMVLVPATSAGPRLLMGGATSSFPALKRDSATLKVRLADDSGDADLTCKALTVSGNITVSTKDIVTDTTTGTKIGTATGQKLGFWNAAPVAQPTTAVAEATVVANAGAVTINDDTTFDGYTLAQIVKALRDTGLLA